MNLGEYYSEAGDYIEELESQLREAERVMEHLVPLENENRALREMLTISVSKECKCKNNTMVNIEVVKRNLELKEFAAKCSCEAYEDAKSEYENENN